MASEPHDEALSETLEIETPQPETENKAPSAPKAAVEHHDKASSREKRESRRQRGLEHVELQNRHTQAPHQPLVGAGAGQDGGDGAAAEAGPEPDRTIVKASPEPDRTNVGVSLEPDRTVAGMDPELDKPTSVAIPEPNRTIPWAGPEPDTPPATTTSSPISGEPTEVLLERPTSLDLDSRGSAPATSITPWALGEQPDSSPGRQESPESPGGGSGGGSCQIQRHRDQDSERLANAVELWRGKKRAASGSAILSQSLDLGSRVAATSGSPTQ